MRASYFLRSQQRLSSPHRLVESTLTAATSNSALYASSRTLFFLSEKSSFGVIKRSLGRTNNGHTPLAAIFASFIPGCLAFPVVGVDRASFQEVGGSTNVIQADAVADDVCGMEATRCLRSAIYRSHTLRICQRVRGVSSIHEKVSEECVFFKSSVLRYAQLEVFPAHY